jgi:hypothetical protein
MEGVLNPISLTYRGNDADESVIDLIEVGHSLTGVGRLYNSVAHFYFHGGEIVARRRVSLVRTYAGPPRAGSLNYILVASLVHQYLPVYSPLLLKLANKALAKLLEFIFASRTGNSAAMDKAIDALKDMHELDVSLMSEMVGKHAATTDKFIALVEKLAISNRPAMHDMVSPIGHSCKSITHFDQTAERLSIDEAAADVMRSKEDLEVGNEIKVPAIIIGVDTGTGSCRVQLTEGPHAVIRGRITDPALRTPHNRYTSALDDKRTIILTAKPIRKDGEITRLYISDAKESA